MPLTQFDTVIRRDLDNIHKDTEIHCTFILWSDTGTTDAWGHPTKTHIDIATSVISSPIKHDQRQAGSGVDEVSDMKIIVHRLESGGKDYINSQFFQRTNIHNIEVVIPSSETPAQSRRYKVNDIRGHDELHAKAPYLVMWLARKVDTP